MSTDTTTLLPRIAAVGASTLAVGALATVASLTGYDSLAKGAVIGGAASILAMLVLFRLGTRGGVAGRVFSGRADERDSRIVTAAFADAAMAMTLATIGSLVGSFYGLPAIGVAGIVLWVGLATVLVSAAVRARRS
ncbi:hypothetical protein [Demequina soli]|uniref:hypothetical protein n=1 Tax=Demequina soli TaxID=1638987 RepID=UPI00078281D7|nr:hypothetical protein [Demequina soli]